MPSWLLKAAVQGTLSVLPDSDRLNGLLQQRVTRSLELKNEDFDAKVAQAAKHLDHWSATTGQQLPPRVVFELGTGWFPIVPVGLALAGAGRVISFDIRPLTGAGRIEDVLHAYARADALGSLQAAFPYVSPSRLRTLREWAHAPRDPQRTLQSLGVHLTVGDARATGVGDHTVDLVISDNTLEHIPEESLRDLMREFARLLATGGVVDHFVDMRDHYADFDARLNRLNYLRYPDGLWRIFNNRLQYQNRLRIMDYRRILDAAGFKVAAEERIEEETSEFECIRVARRFRNMPRNDVKTLYAWLTASGALAPTPIGATPAMKPVGS